MLLVSTDTNRQTELAGIGSGGGEWVRMHLHPRSERRLVFKGYLWMIALTALSVVAVVPHSLWLRTAAAATALCVGWWLYVVRSRTRLAWVGEALTDELTGLYTRRYLAIRMPEELARVERYEGRLTAVLLDLDDFKRLNDHQGHLYGDEVLRSFGRAIRVALGKHDLAFRYGGEEFALLLPSAGESDARELLDRLRSALTTNVSWSAGIASYPGDAERADALLQLADERLLQAKRLGKSMIVGARRPLPRSSSDL